MKRTKIKICGITESRGLDAAIENGADYIGFVFHKSSPRFVTPTQAADLARHIPESILPVGLFVDPDDASIQAVLSQVHLNMIQLHGNESPERTAALRDHTHTKVMKALRIGSKLDAIQHALYDDSCDYILFDAPSKNPGQFGGTGQRFNWEFLQDQKVSKPWMLAGGLTPDNVTEALEALDPDAVDVSSGVESAPGIKDPKKVAAFIAAVRAARP